MKILSEKLPNRGCPFSGDRSTEVAGSRSAGGSLDNLVLVHVNTAARRLFNRDYLTMLIARSRIRPQHPATDKVAALLRGTSSIQPQRSMIDDHEPSRDHGAVTRAGSL